MAKDDKQQIPTEPPLEVGVLMCRLPNGKHRAVEVRVRGDRVLERKPGAVERDGARTAMALGLEMFEAAVGEAQAEDWKK
jgi:hypothetical protein